MGEYRSSHSVTGHQYSSTDTVQCAQDVMISVYVHFFSPLVSATHGDLN